jgi:hypothetical protein
LKVDGHERERCGEVSKSEDGCGERKSDENDPEDWPSEHVEF